MAEIKDKIINVEALDALHKYNQSQYMTKENPAGTGDLNIEGGGTFTEDIYVGDAKLMKVTDIVPISQGGTESSDGATGLANLFAAGETILSSHQFGDELPEAGTAGRIFFKRLIEE